jgi:hypothetical protein
MRRLVALVALVLAACSSSPSGSTASVSPSAIRSPSAGAPPTATPGATPTSPADLPVTPVDFSCRLPVVWSTTDTSGITLHGASIAFPSAQLAEDPAGTMHSRLVEGDYATTAMPILHGDGVVPFYDRVFSRWVPARASQALPDGSGYAYVTWNAQSGIFTAHVVDMATASSRDFSLPGGFLPYVADYDASGVYLVGGSGLGGPGDGVWLLNPKTGAVNEIGHIHQVWAVRGGYAWVARLDPRDTTVYPPSELPPANSLVRINLATGAETVWFYRPGVYPWLLGLASNDKAVLLLGLGPNASEVRLANSAGSSGELVYAGNTSGLDYVQGDGSRLWFGNARGIYLYRPTRGFQKVFAYAADPSTSNRIEPAGLCI